MVSRLAAFRCAQRDRVLPERKSQPDAHWGTRTSGGELEVASVLVRSLPERERGSRSAGRAFRASGKQLTLTRRFAAPSPRGRGTPPGCVLLPWGEGGPKGRLRVGNTKR